MVLTDIQTIRMRLTTLGVSQHALAQALGVSQATLSVWLNGYRAPRPGFVVEAAAALDALEQAERAAATTRAQILAHWRARRGNAWPARTPRGKDGSAAGRT